MYFTNYWYIHSIPCLQNHHRIQGENFSFVIFVANFHVKCWWFASTSLCVNKEKPYYTDSSKNGSNVYNTNAKFASPFNSSFNSWNGTILDDTETRINEYILNTFTKTNTWTFSLKQFHPLLRNVMEICEMLQRITTKSMLSQIGENFSLTPRKYKLCRIQRLIMATVLKNKLCRI